MNKLEIVRYLLDEIEAEQDRFKRYETEKARAKKEADKVEKYYWQCEKWDEPYPCKSRITENCKIVRRMMMGIAKEDPENV